MTRKAWRWACWPWRVCGSQKAAARIAGSDQNASASSQLPKSFSSGAVAPGGERCAQAQGHGVDPGHHPGLAREVAFDDARQEHADDADAGAGQDAAGEQAEHREQAAQDDAAGQAEEDQQHAALGADTPGQARRERREQPQAEYRRGGQQAGGSGREAGIVAHLVEQGGEAGQRRAQVQRHQHQAQQEQPGA